ncbi:hypothetical protein B0T24DRAFT_691474 [Lasiosphaeria ovina]|uniref:Uncharacterized protein n=1 Tax=Lasiosphaeria ovina TaxID=92902 RepID=A0AAE0JUA8_9PEZI|nr:hypothetical protein B0T24DRAFT_691474 [Lasiosphaeria ovina]
MDAPVFTRHADYKVFWTLNGWLAFSDGRANFYLQLKPSPNPPKPSTFNQPTTKSSIELQQQQRDFIAAQKVAAREPPAAFDDPFALSDPDEQDDRAPQPPSNQGNAGNPGNAGRSWQPGQPCYHGIIITGFIWYAEFNAYGGQSSRGHYQGVNT